MEAETTFVPLHDLAQMLGIAESWLRAEAEAERIPYLKTGRRFLFDPETVRRVLRDRAVMNVKREGAANVA